MKLPATNKLKGLLVINLCLLITTCSTKPGKYLINQQDSAYEVINLLPISQNGLFYKTLDNVDNSRITEWMTYDKINQNNRKESYMLEMDRYIDFDTVFTEKQRLELDHKLKTLQSVTLDEKKIVGKQLRYTNEKSEIAPPIDLETISFPVFQYDKNGYIYAFTYYEWASFDGHNGSSEIYIFRRINNMWEKFAVVFVSIS